MKDILNNDTKYKNRYRRTLSQVIGLACLAILLALALVMELVTRENPHYYATTMSGQVLPLQSLTQPVITSKHLLQWAELAARKAVNFNFNNYQDQLNATNLYFTDSGFTQYKSAIEKSIIDPVIKNKLFVSGVVNGPAIILNRYVDNGRFTWVVQMPLLVSFSSASEARKTTYIVTMVISRVALLTKPNGIAIKHFYMKEKVQ